MDIVERLIAAAKARSQSVVLPEGDDERVVLAARRLHDEGVANAILLGGRDRLEEAAGKAGTSLDGISIVDPRDNEDLDAYAELYVAARRGLDIKAARRLMRRPPY